MALPEYPKVFNSRLVHRASILPDFCQGLSPRLQRRRVRCSRPAEVDELFAQWKAAQAKIVSEPEDKPWKLHEFMAADLDGNLIRVFCDFRDDM